MEFTDMEMRYFDTMLLARKGYSRAMEPICRQWDLTRNELDVLLFLANNPQFDRASDVSLYRGMAKSHVSLSVASLEEKGLLCRREDTHDRRAVHLSLTGDAHGIAAQGQVAQRNFFAEIFRGLTGEEMVLWAEITRKVSDNISRMD